MTTILAHTKVSGTELYTSTSISPIVARKLGVKKGDNLVFFEENDRVYVQKA